MIEDLNLEKEIRGLEENEEEDTGVLIMIFFFFILIAGNLLLKLSSLTKIPYPPMLLACCIFFGSLASRLGKLGDALDLCYQISPEMIGLLLLPPIIFESGFQLNWHALRKQMLKVFLLSWIGLLVNALLLGVVIRYVFQYQTIFSFSYAFQLGTILSVPEPGLIIPTLQELGVLKSVQQLIASEQLICCASALVLFGVIEQYLEGNKIQIGEIILHWLRLAIGGPLLALIFGIVCTFWLARIFRDVLLEVLTIFIFPWVLFYACEQTVLKFSGFAGLIVLGLYVSAVGKGRITTEALKFSHAIWSFAEFLAVTAIYALIGLAIGIKIKDLSIDLKDWLLLIPLYLSLFLIRILIVFTFYPLFKKLPYGFTWKNGLLTSYAQIKGPIAIILAMIFYNSDDFEKEARQKTIFFASFMVIFTNLINGTQTRKFIGWLGLDQKEKEQLVIYNQIVEHIIESSQNIIDEDLKYNRSFNFVNWEKVINLIVDKQYIKNIMSYYTDEQGIKRNCFEIEANSNQLKFLTNMDFNSESHIIDKSARLLELARLRFLSILKGIYWSKFDKKEVPGKDIIFLIDFVNYSIDNYHEKINDWNQIEKQQFETVFFKFIKKTVHIKVIKLLFKNYILRYIISSYLITTTYIQSNEQALKELKKFKFQETVYNKIHEEILINIKQSTNFLNSTLLKNFKYLLIEFQNIQGAHTILNYQLEYIEKQNALGNLNGYEHSQLHHAISNKLYQIHQQVEKIDYSQAFTIATVINNLSFFKLSFTDAQRKEIITHAEENVEDSDIPIFNEKEELKYLYIVSNGAISETNNNYCKMHNFGSLFGLQYLMSNTKTMTTCKSLSYAVVIKIPFECFEKYLTLETKYKIWVTIFGDLMELYSEKFSEFYLLNSQKDLKLLLNQTTYLELDNNETMDINSGAILLKGSILISKSFQDKEEEKVSLQEKIKEEPEHEQIWNAPCYIQTELTIQCQTNCSFLIFNETAAVLLDNIKFSNTLQKKQLIKEEEDFSSISEKKLQPEQEQQFYSKSKLPKEIKKLQKLRPRSQSQQIPEVSFKFGAELEEKQQLLKKQ